MTVTLYQGDCLPRMAMIPNGYVDVEVTDVPYGIGENSRKNATRKQLAEPRDYGEYAWDNQRLDRKYFSEMLRVSRNQVIFGGIYYTDFLYPSSSWVVWDKLNSGDFADCELAWTSHKRAVRKFSWMWNGFIKQQPEERFHPTQKPLALMKWILENYTELGNVVLDSFMGSGTTGVAAVLTGRHFIGCEINPDYYSIAEKRIHDAQLQMPMEGFQR